MNLWQRLINRLPADEQSKLGLLISKLHEHGHTDLTQLIRLPVEEFSTVLTTILVPERDSAADDPQVQRLVRQFLDAAHQVLAESEEAAVAGEGHSPKQQPLNHEEPKPPSHFDSTPGGGKDPTWLVHGRVLRAKNFPLSHAVVRAYDKRLRDSDDLALGQPAVTDACGYYRIPYQPCRGQTGCPSVNLQVRVFASTKDHQAMAESAIRFEARPEETVDLVVTTHPQTEYDGLKQLLEPLLEGQTITSLDPSAIQFLAGRLAVDVQRITVLVDAERVAQWTDLPAQAFYAHQVDALANPDAAFERLWQKLPAAFGPIPDESLNRFRLVAPLANVVRHERRLLLALISRWEGGSLKSALDLAYWSRNDWLELLRQAWPFERSTWPDWAQGADYSSRIEAGASALLSGAAQILPNSLVSRYTVSGRILTPLGRAVAGVGVEVHQSQGFLKAGHAATSLPVSAAVLTRSDGRFRLAIAPSSMLQPLHLQTVVQDQGGHELVRSDLIYGASLPLDIGDLKIATERGLTEFEVIAAALEGISGKPDLSAPLPEAQRQWLARVSGIDEEVVARFSEAHKLAAAELPRLPAEVHYALAHPAVRAFITATDRLKAATEAWIVNARVNSHAAEAQTWLNRRAADVRLTNLRNSEALRPLFVAARLEAHYEPYLTVLAEHPHASDSAIADLLTKAGLDSSVQTRLRQAQNLTQLLSDKPDLVQKLLDELPPASRTAGDDGLASFAARDRAAWVDWLNQAVAASKPADHLDQARSLEAAFEAAYPRQALVGRLAAIARVGKANPSLALLAELLDAQVDIDLKRGGSDAKVLADQKIQDYLKSKFPTDPTDVRVNKANGLNRDLSALQRIIKLAGATDATRLLAAGYTSAHDIARQGRESLTAALIEAARASGDVSPDVTIAADATNIHAHAQRQASASLAIAAGLSMGYRNQQPAAIGSLASGSGNSDIKGKLQELFGPMDACNVPECLSVFGEPAYLVDLFELLDEPGNSRNPGKVLFHRRPDLRQIELSCANADTPLPYIDLVIELLEREVAGVPTAASQMADAARGAGRAVSGNPAGAEKWAGLKLQPALSTSVLTALQDSLQPSSDTAYPQTSWSADELAAYPQHLNPAAYAKLSDAVYPWNLPFWLPQAEAEVYLADLGTSRAELISTWRGPDAQTSFKSIDAASAYLGISPSERAVITAGLVEVQAHLMLNNTVPDLLHPPAVVDGTSVVPGNRILVRNGVTGQLWLYQTKSVDLSNPGRASALTWVRLPVLNPGTLITVSQGHDGAGSAWVVLKPSNASSNTPHSEVARRGSRDFSGMALDQGGQPAPWKYWGYTQDAEPKDWIVNTTSSVTTFLQKSGLDHAEFLELLLSRYVNPELNGRRRVTLLPMDGADPCDLSQVRLQKVDLDFLARIHRFTRLRRRLGWSVGELDQAIAVLDAKDITDVLLIHLAEIQRVTARLKLPVGDVLAFWGNLDTQASFDRSTTPPQRKPSAYESVYQDKTRLNAADLAALALPVVTGKPLDAIAPAACSALGLTDADYHLLIGKGSDAANLFLVAPAIAAVGNDALSGLSALYRWNRLSTALGIAVRDLLRLAEFSGIDPFVSPHDTLRLLDANHALNSVRVSIEDADFLLRHVGLAQRVHPFEENVYSILRQTGAAVFGPLPSNGQAASEPPLVKEVTRAITAVLDRVKPTESTIHPEQAADVAVLLGGTLIPDDNPATPPVAKAVRLQNGVELSYNDVLTRLKVISLPLAIDADAVCRSLMTMAQTHSVPGYARNSLLIGIGPIGSELVANALANAVSGVMGIEIGAARALVCSFQATLQTGTQDGLAEIAALLRAGVGPDDAADALTSSAWPVSVRIMKGAWLVGKLGLSHAELELDSTYFQRPLSLLPLSKLPVVAAAKSNTARIRTFGGWMELLQLMGVRECALAQGIDFWKLRAATITAASVSTSWSVAVQAAGWSSDLAEAMTGAGLLGFSEAADKAKPSTWLRFFDALALAHRLDLAPSALERWSADKVDFAAASEMRSTAAAKRGPAAWKQTGPGLRNRLREAQRDALAAHALLQLNQPDLSSLQAHYLVDVSMGAELLTTRIRLATASVQTFVQRALLNLEIDPSGNRVTQDSDFAERWSWMKSYRTWADCRKRFLYPENYLLPELRDDKSQFFIELEQQLSQRELTDAAVEDAIGDYLEKLDRVSRIEIMGMCVEMHGKQRALLHMVGRTSGIPHEHFHRTWDFHTRMFSPWTRLDIGIDGDWILPLIQDGHLTIYWIKHSRQIEGMKDTLGLIPTHPFPLTPHYPMYQDQYSLSWSIRRRKGWAPKRSAERFIARPFFPFLPAKFAVRLEGNRLKIAGVTVLPRPAGPGGIKAEAQSGFKQIKLTPPPDPSTVVDRVINAFGSNNDNGGSGSFSSLDPALGVNTLSELINLVSDLKKLIEGDGNGDAWSIKKAFEHIGDHLPPEFKQAAQFLADPGLKNLLDAISPPNTLPERAIKAVIREIGKVLLSYIHLLFGAVESLVHSAGRFEINGNHPILIPSTIKEGLQQIVSGLEGLSNLGWIGPEFGLEFGFFDVGSSGVRALRLTPPPDFQLPIPLPIGPITDVFNTVGELKRVLYSIFPGYPGLFDIPVLEGLLSTDLPILAPSVPMDATLRAWPGTGYFVLPQPAPGEPANYCTVAINIKRLVKDELEAGALPQWSGDNPLGEDIKGTLEGLMNAADAAIQDIGSGALFNIGMRVVRPLAFDPYPDRLGNPVPLTLSEDRHGRSYLLVPETATDRIPSGWHSWDLIVSATRWNALRLHHPLTSEMLNALERNGVDGLFGPPTAPEGDWWWANADTKNGFSNSFVVSVAGKVTVPDASLEILDLDPTGACSLYNWELFFHLPMLLGGRFMAQKGEGFGKALQWFRRVFDPTFASGSAPQRYWRFKKFYDEYDPQTGPEPVKTIKSWLKALASGELSADQASVIARWRQDPFNAHFLARLRPGAYERAAVMRTIEALIAWGDACYRIDTWESINEATLYYQMARDILGPRPNLVPATSTEGLTYAQLRKAATNAGYPIDSFGNALLSVETAMPDPSDTSDPASELVVFTGSSMLYFGIPANDRLLGYWDSIDDRLARIHHNLDFYGHARPAFGDGEPLSFSLGTEISTVPRNGQTTYSTPIFNWQVPIYRFPFLLQKAYEFAGDVKALGSALLSVMEKRDAEGLALLRATKEKSLLEAVEAIRKAQIDEASRALEAIQRAQDGAKIRQEYYRSREFMNASESVKEEKSRRASEFQLQSGLMELGAAIYSGLPQVTTTLGKEDNVAVSYGSTQLSGASSALARLFSLLANIEQTESGLAGTAAFYQRRKEDWDHQFDLATNEIEQFKKQYEAAIFRLYIANREYINHQQQIKDSTDILGIITGKPTNVAFYEWMIGEVSAIHYEAYLLAVDMARRAQACYRFERAEPERTFIHPELWGDLSSGLLAGERLQQELRRMEAAYLDANVREHELVKHISLALVHPEALLMLQQQGECYVDLPEWLFDGDYPGHYLRRVKTVSITIPGVTGPYTSINCSLTLVTSRIRINSSAEPPYARQTNINDPRFINLAPSTSVIATSSAQNDSGLFELNLRDERYLPFEGAGAIGTWHIELPKATNRFDFASISDVVIHLHYTARDGGTALHDLVWKETLGDLPAPMDPANANMGLKPNQRMLSVRHEFPDAWYRFLNPAATADPTIELNLSRSSFPYIPEDNNLRIRSVQVFVIANPAEAADGLKARLVFEAGAGQSENALPSPGLFEPFTTLPNLYSCEFKATTSANSVESNLGVWNLTFSPPENPAPSSTSLLMPGATPGKWRVSSEKIRDLLFLIAYDITT